MSIARFQSMLQKFSDCIRIVSMSTLMKCCEKEKTLLAFNSLLLFALPTNRKNSTISRGPALSSPHPACAKPDEFDIIYVIILATLGHDPYGRLLRAEHSWTRSFG